MSFLPSVSSLVRPSTSLRFVRYMQSNNQGSTPTDSMKTVDTTPAPPSPPPTQIDTTSTPPPTIPSTPIDSVPTSNSDLDPEYYPLPNNNARYSRPKREPTYIPDPKIPYPVDSSGRPDLFRRTTTIKGNYTIYPKRLRPARKISVNLPNGQPEPTEYPVTAKHVAMVEARPADPRHPLWAFFNLPEGAEGGSFEGQESPMNMGSLPDMAFRGKDSVDPEGRYTKQYHNMAIRAWTAEELRLKSFADLHVLWYLCLRERNVFATQQSEMDRLKIPNDPYGVAPDKRRKCQKTMARIKYVLNERRLGLIAAATPSLPPRNPMPTWADPKGSQNAMWGLVEFPDVRIPKRHRHLVEAEGEELQQEQEQMGDKEGEGKNVVRDGEVSESEVGGRDEGFGGGRQAEEFVDDVEVGEDGRVHKK